jgi:glycine cleavage system H protein
VKVYSSEHEWAEIDEYEATIGVSKYAVEQLGDVTFIELPEVGAMVIQNDSAAFIESVKAASDVYSPLSGMILDVNDELNDRPELLNESPEDGGWIYKIKMSNPAEMAELMDEEAYAQYIASL